MIKHPLDAFSEVVDQARKWNPEWYSWLEGLVTKVETDIDQINTDIDQINNNLSNLVVPILGQCRLSVTNTTTLTLDRYQGKHLFINGVLQLIPSSGVTISNAGLSSNTVYNVYAFMLSGVMMLELSTVGWVMDSTYGHKVKSGDPTRTLVGKIRTVGSLFGGGLLCINLFNRRDLSALAFLAGDVPLGSSPFSPVHPTLQIPFIDWGEDSIDLRFETTVVVNAGATLYASPAIDNSTVGAAAEVSDPGDVVSQMSVGAMSVVTEGFHIADGFGGIVNPGGIYLASGFSSVAITIRG
jgi:hypothetical protein